MAIQCFSVKGTIDYQTIAAWDRVRILFFRLTYNEVNRILSQAVVVIFANIVFGDLRCHAEAIRISTRATVYDHVIPCR